jgi:type II secretory pathway pseudopilin PulG
MMKRLMLTTEKNSRCCDVNRSRSGFTLVETLVSMLFVLLLMGIVSTGISMSVRVYQQSTFVSESAVLEDSISSALSAPLHAMARQSDGSFTTTIDDEQYSFTDASALSSMLQVKSEDPNDHLHIFLDDSAGHERKILNGGTYADCEISNISTEVVWPSPGSTVAATDRTPVRIKVTYTIRSTVDTSLTKNVQVDFTSAAVNATAA